MGDDEDKFVGVVIPSDPAVPAAHVLFEHCGGRRLELGLRPVVDDRSDALVPADELGE